MSVNLLKTKIMNSLKIKSLPFINSELAAPVANLSNPHIILSFGNIDGKIEDIAVSVGDAREIVKDIISNLISLGDPVAKSIQEEYFN